MSDQHTSTGVPARPPRPPAFANKIMAAVLRSPLHGLLSGSIMLITFTGRKSGKQITTPVSQIADGDGFWFTVASPWWKNLRGGAPVTLRVKGRDLRGIATPDENPASIQRTVRRFLEQQGVKRAFMLGLKFPDGQMPTDAELAAATAGRVVVTVKLTP